VFRRLLARETLSPSWRELLAFYRAAEARGEIRGGRFVEPLGGEQFALIEAVEQLRRLRRSKDADEWVAVSAADPVNLTGMLDNAPRAAATPRVRLVFRNGTAVASSSGAGIDWLVELTPAEQQRAAAALTPATGSPGGEPARRWRHGA
jgi:ATP-dependent helicase Lhr and Lhr-like helicase